MQRVVGMERSNVAHATIEAMVGAVAIEPHLMLPCADDDLVCAALRSYPELFRCMREELRQEFSQEFYQSFLYDALELDDELRQEFLATAGKTEINAWLWNRNLPGDRGRGLSPKVPAEPATLTEAGKQGKRGGRRCRRSARGPVNRS